MNISQSDKDHLYWEVYNIDGRGLSDYLNDWTPDKEYMVENNVIMLKITSTMYGEKLLLCGDHYEYGEENLFDVWSKWHHDINSCFDVFIDMQSNTDVFNNIDEIKEFFIFKMCKKLGIIDELKNYLKVIEPYSNRKDVLDAFGCF